MNIYIDESGTFASTPSTNSWCVVTAVTVPEGSRKKLDSILCSLKRNLTLREVKLKHLTEEKYLDFLGALAKIEIVLFCVATDSGLNEFQRVSSHRDTQCEEILKHTPKMKHLEGKSAIEHLASQIKQLSPQLYVQLTCQALLLEDIVSRAINYYAQRCPQTLKEFRWRFDRKNTLRTDFEDSFEKLVPTLLQTRSIANPVMRVIGFDYSHMSKYEFPEGKLPEYLERDYGIQVEHGFDIQKLIRGNIQFVDSAEVLGVQAADLLASGMKRCLRGEFRDNVQIAKSLGRLTIQGRTGGQSIKLVSFGSKSALDGKTSNVVRALTSHCKPMILHTGGK